MVDGQIARNRLRRADDQGTAAAASTGPSESAELRTLR